MRCRARSEVRPWLWWRKTRQRVEQSATFSSPSRLTQERPGRDESATITEEDSGADGRGASRVGRDVRRRPGRAECSEGEGADRDHKGGGVADMGVQRCKEDALAHVL